MRYDDDAYREVFPIEEPKQELKIETPIETFMPSKEEVKVEEPVVEKESFVNETKIEEEKGE